jgi:lysozyme family protein
MSRFAAAFEALIGHEGGYVNHPQDPGGETKYGISKRSYPDLDIAALTLEGAREIYQRDFWAPLACDQLPSPVALVLFDTAVNSGVGTAAKILQQILGVKSDGAIGPVTVAAALKRGAVDLAGEIIARRLYLMTGLPTWGVFGMGWTRRLVRLAGQAAALPG